MVIEVDILNPIHLRKLRSKSDFESFKKMTLSLKVHFMSHGHFLSHGVTERVFFLLEVSKNRLIKYCSPFTHT